MAKKENKYKGYGISTQAIHTGTDYDEGTGAVRRPLHMANSYKLPDDLSQVNYSSTDLLMYSRNGNPNQHWLEEKIAALHDADDAIVLASGVAALHALFWTLLKSGDRVIYPKVSYMAVYRMFYELFNRKFGVETIMVDMTDLEAVRKAVSPGTRLVHIETPDNPTNGVTDIEAIAKIAHEHGALMFTDAVQAVGNIPVNVKELGVDMLALSGHKIHAPKGIGALYVKTGVRINNLIDGGGQERGKRGGTENMPYIIGLATAIESAVAKLPEMEKVAELRDMLIDRILSEIPHTSLNGPRGDMRLPGNVNIGFEYIEGESMLLLLDFQGIAASTGSACSSASLDPSHVLLAIGVPHERAHGSLRLSISNETTKEDIEYILEKLPPIIQRLRDMSPLYENVKE